MGTGINLSQGERMMILLYGTETRCGSIREIRRTMALLEPDETELRCLMESTIQKLQSISDTAFDDLRQYRTKKAKRSQIMI